MNYKQRKILKILNNAVGLRYSELYKYFVEEDKFPYHLKYLIKNKYAVKLEDKYFLTPKGSAYAVNWIDSDYNEMVHKVPRILLVCKNQDKYLVKEYSHNMIEFKSFYGLPDIKLPFGLRDVELAISDYFSSKFFVNEFHSFRCLQNVVFVNSQNEVMLDFLYLVFDVDISGAGSFKLPEKFKWMTLEQLRPIRKISSVIEDFVMNNLREPFSKRIVPVG